MFVLFENIGPAHLSWTSQIKRDDPSSIQRALTSRVCYGPKVISCYYAPYGEQGTIALNGTRTDQHFTLLENPPKNHRD